MDLVLIERACERFQQQLSVEENRKIQEVSNVDDVRHTICRIEQHIAARRSLQYLGRLTPFLDAIDRLSKPIEILCSGTAFMPYAWAPLKLILETAQHHTHAMDKLLSAYESIGVALPRLARNGEIFLDNYEFQPLLSCLYGDIIEFHTHAFRLIQKPGWKIFFSSGWGRFKHQFDALLQSIARTSELIDKEAVSLDVNLAQEWRQKLLEDTAKRERRWESEQHEVVLQWLEVGDLKSYQEDKLELLQSRCCKGTSQWLTKTQQVRSWLQFGRGHSVLWLYGKPGSGKTVLCSQLIYFLRSDPARNCFFFFCDFHTTSYGVTAQILRSFCAQMIDAAPELASFMYDECVIAGRTASISCLKAIVPKLLTAFKDIRIVIDGINEIGYSQHRELIKTLSSLAEAQDNCKVLFSSQDIPSIRSNLMSKPELFIRAESASVTKDLNIIIATSLKGLNDRFGGRIPDAVLADVRKSILKRAKGMFLWVYLVFRDLEAASCIEDIRTAMEACPTDLADVYYKILTNITSSSSANDLSKQRRVFGWMLFAKGNQPLRKHELRLAMTLDSESCVIDRNNKPLPNALEICKPFIEDVPGAGLVFIHSTVPQFLLGQSSGPFIDEIDAHRDISLACLAQLRQSFRFVAEALNREEHQYHIGQGFHGLLPYANEYWLEHLLEYLQKCQKYESIEMSPVVQQLLALCHEHSRLLETQGRQDTSNVDTESQDSRLQCLEKFPAVFSLLNRVLRFRQAVKIKTTNELSPPSPDPTLFSSICRAYHEGVVRLMAQSSCPSLPPEELMMFKEEFGPSAFVCRIRGCDRSVVGYPSANRLKDHEAQHERQQRPRFLALSAQEQPQQSEAVEAAPPTDSGYASVPAMEMDLDSPRKYGEQAAAEPVQELAEQDIDDTATEYSDMSSTTSSRKQQYIGELAGDLFSKISWLRADEKSQTEALAILPELLQAFALKLGYDAPTQMHRDIMAFVHRHRRDIAKVFEDIGFEREEEGLKKSTTVSDGMSLQDRMALWEEKNNYEAVSVEERIRLNLDDIDPDGSEIRSNSPDPEAGVEEVQDEEVPHSWFVAYRKLIHSTEAYEWLLTRLRREFRLVSAEPNTIQAIRATIMSSLPTARRISRNVSSQSCSARFKLDWDVLKFFQTQGYSPPPDQVLKGVITLTGSCHDAQAATCAQYIRQTWPLTGEAMVHLVEEVLRGGDGYVHSCKISDGTTLTAWTSRSKFVVEANGVAVSIAETGEQLAWFGAALRTSPRQSGLIYYTPIITNILQKSAQSQKLSTDVTYEIGFTMEEVPNPPRNAIGQCWHDIFRNPVVVRGYPIPQRTEWETGLEISLNIMAGLAGTQRVDRFKEKVYIKGFSTMLVPTKRNEDILCWHLIYKKDGSRISYLDDSVDQEQHFGSLDLENLRHVLGWCSEVKFYAGSAQADHPSTYSRLPKPHEGCALAKTRVSAGRMIIGGPAFSIGEKDTPVQVSRNGYIPKLEWISTKFVLLWDENDKRGWLINGTSALLHVLRASLEYSSRGRFQSVLLCKSDDLEDSPTPFTADSAVDVLINPNNRNLKLYYEGDGYLLLESLIERFYNVLEKLIDHQIDIAGECGRNLGDKPRRYLEGWDFEDLAKKEDPLYPCVATLNAAGKGWVDLTRAIHAVTLIGRGFGDIIRPAGVDLCEYWAELPKRQYYIASCLSDLIGVMREHDSCGHNHVRLSDNLIWHTPTTVFASCRCRGALGGDHSEPVQTIFPLQLSPRLLPRKHPIQKEGNGAVIFGHSSYFSWIWGDTGHPQEGKLNEEASFTNAVEVNTDSPEDSGIGPSLARSGSEVSSRRRLMQAPSEPHNDTTPTDSSDFVKKKMYGRGRYKVGIICALPKELMAVRALFDDDHESPRALASDINQYSLGVMEQHWIVAACLPNSEYGTNSAAAVAANMLRSFTSIRFCLLVGIAGGAPSEKNDIRLGDVVVSQSAGNCSGVIQYDLGKEMEGKPFERTGSLRPPPRVLNTAISSLRSHPALLPDPLAPHLQTIAARLKEFPKYKRPEKPDVLFQTACAACQTRQVSQEECSHLRQRVPRRTDAPVIHYGLIASGNRVVKNAAIRDQLAEDGVLCIEMEAAGVLNTVDCLVIRGICDYCDAQKNDDWQEYAAAAAAGYTKLLLGFVANEEDTRRPRKKRRLKDVKNTTQR